MDAQPRDLGEAHRPRDEVARGHQLEEARAGEGHRQRAEQQAGDPEEGAQGQPQDGAAHGQGDEAHRDEAQERAQEDLPARALRVEQQGLGEEHRLRGLAIDGQEREPGEQGQVLAPRATPRAAP